ncbi:MAG: hypothetical protein U9N32_00950 [Spirochaetota bacterium]|nr:hypothetical protein [Spirochaetota bacterium]
MDWNIEIHKSDITKKLPPITRELSGLVKFETQKTDKELLLSALEKKYLQKIRKDNYQKY